MVFYEELIKDHKKMVPVDPCLALNYNTIPAGTTTLYQHTTVTHQH